MERLNYYNLFSFWTVAREGGVARACRRLHLAQPTVSGQIRQLEKELGQRLFQRAGRGLELTESGQLVYRYADEIFSLGRELIESLDGQQSGRQLRLLVGVTDALPKAVAYRFLQPALELPQVRLVCQEGKADQLLAELSLHRLDVVLSDAPPNPSVKVRAFAHLLGESEVSIVGVEPLAKRLRTGFPDSLEGAPFFLATENTALRRSLEQWFDARGLRPVVKAEFEDSALLKSFGRAGGAVFAIPTVVEADVCRQFGVAVVGRLGGVRERFFAISVERRLKHPGVLAITERARSLLRG